MSDEPISIINEYLALVREKLPESIADDVITELESYMHETARDQGEDGQITFESAKRVVAQFGAPGEVADEYRFSMLPETIPEEVIPPELTQEAVKEPIIVEPEKPTPKVQGVDPTISYSMFFIKSLLLTILWASLVSIIPLMSTPFWAQGILLIFITIPVLCVTAFLLAQTFYLKGRKTILWKRSYPDWSIFQTLVTLPENSIPEAGANLNRLDIVASFIGVLIFAPTIFQWNHPFGYIIGIPTAILLIARIKLTVRKLDEDKDPYENSRLEFGVNLSLLVLLESSIYWLFNIYGPWYYYSVLNLIGPFITTFVILFGPVLLFQLLVGAQNLWWKTEKKVSEEQKIKKVAVRKDTLRNGVTMLVKIIGWIVISDSIVIYSSLVFAPEEMSMLYWTRLSGLIGSIILAVSLVIVYNLIRHIRVQSFNSITFIGRRTRLEALIDSIISIFLIVMVAGFAFTVLLWGVDYSLFHFYPNIFHISINLGEIVIGIEFLSLLVVIIALALRVHGNILEFKSELKIDASRKMQTSGKLMLIILPFIAGGEMTHYISSHSFAASIMMPLFYFLFIFLVTFVAFQVISSELKVRELTNIRKSTKVEDTKPIAGNNDYSASIAN